MVNGSRLVFALTLIMVVSLMLVDMATASYKKPPFNGSIFGKRSSSSNGEYETAGKALSSICEVASEVCAAWFPNGENKK